MSSGPSYPAKKILYRTPRIVNSFLTKEMDFFQKSTHSQTTLTNIARVRFQRTVTVVADPIFGAEVTAITSEASDQVASRSSGLVQHRLTHLSGVHFGAFVDDGYRTAHP